MTARERRVQRKLKQGDDSSTQPIKASAVEKDGSKGFNDGKSAKASKRQSKAGSDQQLSAVRRSVTTLYFLPSVSNGHGAVAGQSTRKEGENEETEGQVRRPG